MTDTMISQHQSPHTKRPLSPSETRNFKTQKSISDDLGPVMKHVHLVENAESSDTPDGELLLEIDLVEADELMHAETPEGYSISTDKIESDDAQTGPTSGSHHVKDLVEQYEIKNQDDIEEVDGRISAREAFGEESQTFFHDIGRKVKHIAAEVGQTVVDMVDDLKKEAHKIRCLLPKSSMEEDPHSNVDVPHPSHTGKMVSLGMNIHKVNTGHLIQEVISGGLAEKAQLKTNDIIKKVNNTDVTSWEFYHIQQFFGNLKSVEFVLAIDREVDVDENGLPLYTTLTVKIELSLDAYDQAVVEIDILYTAWRYSYAGAKPSELKIKNIFQEGDKTSKYLQLSANSCCMTTEVTENNLFKLYVYKPNAAVVLYNMGMSRPLDLGKKSRMGKDKDLTASNIDITRDRRFFKYQKHPQRPDMIVLELLCNQNHFLTVANDDTIEEKYFSSVMSVPNAGIFQIQNATDTILDDVYSKKK